MKVFYKERTFLDNYRCIDKERMRFFDKRWEVGGLTYFKHGQFTTFTIETNMIIRIEK